MEDEILSCVDCAEPFVFTASERAFYLEKQFFTDDGFVKLPIRCVGCRRLRKQQRKHDDRQRAAVRW